MGGGGGDWNPVFGAGAERSATGSGTGSPAFTHTLACAGRAEKVRSSGVWAPTFWETSAPNGPEQMTCNCALDESCRVSTLKPFSYRLRACNSSVEATVRLVHVRGANRRPEENLTNWSRRLFLAPPGPSHPGGMRTSNRGTRPCLAAGETPEQESEKINTRALLGVAGEAAPRLAAAAAGGFA